jgi:hypothetical protein
MSRGVKSVPVRGALAGMESGLQRAVVRADEHIVSGTIGYDEDHQLFEFPGEMY